MKKEIGFIVLIFLLLCSRPARSQDLSIEELSLEQKVKLYVDGLSKGNLEMFFIYNYVYLSEEKTIKQEFPKIMWEGKLSPIKKKWKKILHSSTGKVSKKQLWDYLYEPGSEVNTEVLEIRPDESKAFIRLEYPNYEIAPITQKKDI